MVASHFVLSADAASLRRRLLLACEASGLSREISPTHIVITPRGFSLGNFTLQEIARITNMLEDIAEAAGTKFLASRHCEPKQQSMEVPMCIPVDFTPAKVVKRVKAMI